MRAKMLSWLKERALKAEDWEQLSTLGTSKIVRLSYIWMIAIPIIAKLLQGLEPHYDLRIFGTKFPLNLTLPFSWVMFYFGSVCFALASAIFAIGCPPNIAKYRNASDFMDLENSELAVRQQAANAATYEQSVGLSSPFLSNFTGWFCKVEGKTRWNATIENVIAH